MTKEISDAILLMNHADILGSIMKFDLSESTRNAIIIRTQEYQEQLANGEFVPEVNQLFIPYMNIILALTDKYAAICMNPPYMGSGRFDSMLSKYVKDNYPRSKADLFSVFMDVATDRLKPNGKYGMINMHSWMFLSSFEELRRDLLDNYSIDSLLHLGPRTFDELSGEVVQNAAFVISNTSEQNSCSIATEQWQPRDVEKIGTYFRLVDGKNCSDKERMYLEAQEEHTEKVYYAGVEQERYRNIPAYTFGYWISPTIISALSNDSIKKGFIGKEGVGTRDDARFLRNIWEVSSATIGKGKKWIVSDKAGNRAKWFGNILHVMNWENDGYEIKNFRDENGKLKSRPQNLDYLYKEALSWAKVSTSTKAFRYRHDGYAFNDAAPSLFVNGNQHCSLYYVLAFLNSNVGKFLLGLFGDPINTTVSNVETMPLKLSHIVEIENSSKQNVTISKLDWDAHETSWDFKRNELLNYSDGSIDAKSEALLKTDAGHKLRPTSIISSDSNKDKKTVASSYEVYKQVWEARFMQLHANEEELNRQFIEIYGLQDEITKDVPLEEITILQQGEISIKEGQIKWHDDIVMKQLISYAVGCMMGRYSIDKEGLILANQGDSEKEYAELVPNSHFEVDDDGIIPLMASDTDFADNATKRFKQWLSVTLGEDNLVENLNFIEGALGKSLDDYFVKDFWKDHKKMYQNRPIYWLFSSKKGAFQCLAYMHRMNPYTAESIRTKYLLPHIEWLLQKQSEMEANAANLTTAERRKLDTVNKQIEECREYHDRLHVIADQQIAFDLDDGVVVNYAKFGDVLQKLK